MVLLSVVERRGKTNFSGDCTVLSCRECLLKRCGRTLCLVELPAEDPNGERWTHYRHYTDVYARIDYLMVSRALRREVVGPARICSAPQWKKASDHRLLYTTIAPENR